MLNCANSRLSLQALPRLAGKHPAAFLMSRVDVDTWMTGSDGGSLALLVIVRRLRGLDYGLGGQIRGIASRLFLR
jgi:hypothetical protein